jgi:hypothetical protein
VPVQLQLLLRSGQRQPSRRSGHPRTVELPIRTTVNTALEPRMADYKIYDETTRHSRRASLTFLVLTEKIAENADNQTEHQAGPEPISWLARPQRWHMPHRTQGT